MATGVCARSRPPCWVLLQFGGFPGWLINVTGLTIRTYNQPYITLVDRWWNELLPRVKPLLYENGGPVVMMQVRPAAVSGVRRSWG